MEPTNLGRLVIANNRERLLTPIGRRIDRKEVTGRKYTWVDTFRTALMAPESEVQEVLNAVKCYCNSDL